jgi:hypothetical protein
VAGRKAGSIAARMTPNPTSLRSGREFVDRKPVLPAPGWLGAAAFDAGILNLTYRCRPYAMTFSELNKRKPERGQIEIEVDTRADSGFGSQIQGRNRSSTQHSNRDSLLLERSTDPTSISLFKQAR